KFLTALQQAIGGIADYLAENQTHVDDKLQGFYFDALHFTRVAELFDKHSLFDIAKASDNWAARYNQTRSVLCFRNVIPAPSLSERFAAAHSAAMFSATLSPWHFYSD